MKTILDGIRYNTEKATLIGEASFGHHGDFARWEAGLYVTPRSGRYFLAGEGGPMSFWAEAGDQPGERRSGSGIRPMSPKAALEWAERHLTTEEVEAAFGDQIEDA